MHPANDQLRREPDDPKVKDQVTGRVQAAHTVETTVTVKDVDAFLKMSLEDSGPLSTRATVKVEFSDLEPVSYQVDPKVLARIRQQYTGSTPISSFEEDATSDDVDQDTKQSPFNVKHDAKDLYRTMANLLRWQQALQVVDDLGQSGDLRSVEKAHQALVENLTTKYADRMGELRAALSNQRHAVPLLREWLRSRDDALIDLAIQLAGDPGLRTSLQGDLARLVTDGSLPLQTRQRAYDYLRRWRRETLTRPGPAAQEPPD